MKQYLWEILVPVSFNNGTQIEVEYHQMWDDKVLKLVTGMTIMGVSKGTWKSFKNGKRESMIPVRIMCTTEIIKKIVKITAKHYGQQAIMYCRISDKVIIQKFE